MTKKLESDFNAHLLGEIERRWPESEVINQDPNVSFQGVQDKLVLNGPKWALLESKRATKATRRPNQEYHVERFNEMGFSAFIYPENCDEVLDALDEYFNS